MIIIWICFDDEVGWWWFDGIDDIDLKMMLVILMIEYWYIGDLMALIIFICWWFDDRDAIDGFMIMFILFDDIYYVDDNYSDLISWWKWWFDGDDDALVWYWWYCLLMI